MKPGTVRSLVSLAVVLAFATGALWAEAPRLELANFHARVHMTNAPAEAKGKAGTMSMDGEYWIKGKKMRMALKGGPGGNMSTIMDEAFLYSWAEGQPQGIKMAMTPDKSRDGATLARANDCLKSAASKGSETIDGVACDKYVYDPACDQKGTTTTIWISKSKPFPKKLETRTAEGVTTIVYSDVQTSAKIADTLFVPPKDVSFQDMGEMMKQMQKMQKSPQGK